MLRQSLTRTTLLSRASPIAPSSRYFSTLPTTPDRLTAKSQTAPLARAISASRSIDARRYNSSKSMTEGGEKDIETKGSEELEKGLPDLDPSLLSITPTASPTSPLPDSSLVFGKTFTDHMLTIEWNEEKGWSAGEIKGYAPLALDPSCTVFHYAFCAFEGMKAYKCEDGTIRLFRPDMNMARMNRSARRLALPTFNGEAMIEMIKKLVMIDQKFIPTKPGYSLYVRPTIIGTQAALGVGPSSDALLFTICSPVGPYYSSGFKAVGLKATTDFVRATHGGTGGYKLGANYSPGVVPQKAAAAEGYAQNLWLDGPERYLTEVGTMNLFVVLETEDGGSELLTPPLEDLILPGVTRDSILQLATKHASGEEKIPGLPDKLTISERKITMSEIVDLSASGKLKEIFGAGTAAIVTSVDKIGYEGKDIPIPCKANGLGDIAEAMLNRMQDIQFGRVESPWSVIAGRY